MTHIGHHQPPLNGVQGVESSTGGGLNGVHGAESLGRGGGRRRARARAATLSALAALLLLLAHTVGGGTPSGSAAVRDQVVGAGAPRTTYASPPAVISTEDSSRPSAPSRPAPPDGPRTAHPVDDQRADPATIAIPAIGVEASVIALEVEDSALQVPADFSQAGWWRAGPEPGEVGPAVIVGHVDSHRGPAVFYRLRDLVVGDQIHVTRTDGSVATFAVTGSTPVRKDAFPTADVYGPTDDRALRLITCDGDFADGSYLGNLIVDAVLIDESDPPRAGELP